LPQKGNGKLSQERLQQLPEPGYYHPGNPPHPDVRMSTVGRIPPPQSIAPSEYETPVLK